MERDVAEVLEELRRRKRNLSYDDLLGLMRSVDCQTRPTLHGCLVISPVVVGFMASVAKPHGKSGTKTVGPRYVENCIHLLERALEEEEASHEGEKV